MNEHDVLCRARNLIDREGWFRGRWEGALGWHSEGRSPRCAGIAITDAARGFSNLNTLARKAFIEVNGIDPASPAIPRFNNTRRTKAEVLAAFDKAISATAPPPADPFPATQEPEPVGGRSVG